MRYVALLRGINVGGNAKIEMSRLRQVFQDVGCQDVVTYINSGNVIFTDERDSSQITPVLETAITEEFGLVVPAMVRTDAQVAALCEAVPKDWTNDSVQKTDVLFLWQEIDNDQILTKVKTNPEIEQVLYVGGALVWNIARENVTRGNGIKLIKSDLYQHMTVRNINTVRRLNELLHNA